jgi:diacylglycerol kinase family enzyme
VTLREAGPVVVIANPVAGSGLAGRLRPRLEVDLRRAGHEVRFVETRARGDARAEAGRSAGAAAVVVVGGDGTVNEVLNGLPLPDAPPLAVVPAGTANVMAKELGIPRDVPGVEQLAESLARLLSPAERRPKRGAPPARTEAERAAWIVPALAAGRVARIDVGLANGRRFACMAGAGLDARIVRVLDAGRTGPISMAQYPVWALQALVGYRPPRIGVTVDGREVADDAGFVIVSSSVSYGGAFTFTPDARLDDGILDVAVFRGRGIDELVRWLAAAWLGRAGEDRLCRIVRGRAVRLASDGEVDLQVDGDPAGTLPAMIEVREKALAVLVPG